MRIGSTIAPWKTLEKNTTNCAQETICSVVCYNFRSAHTYFFKRKFVVMTTGDCAEEAQYALNRPGP